MILDVRDGAEKRDDECHEGSSIAYHNPIDPENATRTTHMNGNRYNWLVRSKFADWRNCSFPDGKPVSLFQDYERCLWQDWDLENL